MKNKIILLFLFILSYSAKAQDMVVSSYFIGSDFRDSWIELIVTKDNSNIKDWLLGDYEPNGGGHLNNYSSIKFKNKAIWTNLRGGTIILLYCRSLNSAGLANLIDTNAEDGFIAVHAQLTSFFDDCPATNDNKLKIHSSADMITLKLLSHIHSLGHGTNNSNFNINGNPKLYNDQVGLGNRLIQACPAANLAQYNNIKEDTIATNMTALGLTQGLPNIRSGNLDSNLAYWLKLREPSWTAPILNISSNLGRTCDTLKWNVASDLFPSDSTQGYIILKSSNGLFPANPEDGTVYNLGSLIGGNPIIAIISNSQITSYTYTHILDCNKIYYRVFAYRYKSDKINGNGYHRARGRAYNQVNFASGNSSSVNPIPILYHY